MHDESLAKRFGRPAAGALLGLGVAWVYWVLEGWVGTGGAHLADCATWFGGLGFVGGLITAFESETDLRTD